LDFFIALGTTGYADSFRNLDHDSHDLAAGIRLSHFLGNRQAEGLDLAARASRRQGVDAVENFMQLVDLDVRLAVNEVERSRQWSTIVRPWLLCTCRKAASWNAAA
jgi:hypothetical protein